MWGVSVSVVIALLAISRVDEPQRLLLDNPVTHGSTGRTEWDDPFVKPFETRALHFRSRIVVGLSALLCGVLISSFASAAGAATTSSASSPLSASFVSSGAGWSLTLTNCGAEECVRLEQTRDEGEHWFRLHLPTALQSWLDANSSVSNLSQNQPGVYFANTSDGWIYGASSLPVGIEPPHAELWATHDGGLTWSRISVAPLALRFDVLTMSSSNGWAYAIGWRTGDTFNLWRTQVGSDAWQRVATPTLDSAAGGSTMEGAMVFRGDVGWLMVGNDRGMTGQARMTPSGRWVKWNAPCGPVGDSYAVPVATSAKNLYDVCTIGGYGGDVAPGTRTLKMNTDWLFSSHNGGLSFSPIREIGGGYSTQWLGGISGATAPSTLFLEKLIQNGNSSVEKLQISRDEAKTWTTVYSVRSNVENSFFGPVSFANDSLGSDIVDTGQGLSWLLISTDEGLKWVRSSV